ncbi:MAG: hypothetical protein V5A62_09235 [Haloarculaceae archaeon]
MSSTETAETGLEIGSLPTAVWVGVLAAVVSGLTHLRLGIGNLPSPLGISFLLAGIAFLVAVALVLVGYRRRTVYAVGIPFTLAQILAWYYLNFAAGPKSFPADVGTLGAVDKVAQLVLIVVLVALLR